MNLTDLPPVPTDTVTLPEVLHLARPLRAPLPLLLDSPHSGRHHPADFDIALPREDVRRLEDSFVDALYDFAPELGATWLVALSSRAYLDLNRHGADIDPLLCAQPFPGARPTRDSELGRGLIWRTLTDGRPIYDRRLSIAEVLLRIERLHRPYHRHLVGELQRLHRRFGAVWHLNCHSMPSVSGVMSLDGRGGVARPDFVLGDGDGSACEPGLTRLVHDTLEGMGYHVVDNDPYKGAELTLAYSRPALGFNSLQIEVNRRLYLNEADCTLHAGFEPLKRHLRALVARVAEYVGERIVRAPAAA